MSEQNGIGDSETSWRAFTTDWFTSSEFRHEHIAAAAGAATLDCRVPDSISSDEISLRALDRLPVFSNIRELTKTVQRLQTERPRASAENSLRHWVLQEHTVGVRLRMLQATLSLKGEGAHAH